MLSDEEQDSQWSYNWQREQDGLYLLAGDNMDTQTSTVTVTKFQQMRKRIVERTRPSNLCQGRISPLVAMFFVFRWK